MAGGQSSSEPEIRQITTYRGRFEAAVRFRIANPSVSYASIARQFGIPKATLWRRVNVPPKPRGGQQAFSVEQETVFAGHLLLLASWLFPITRRHLIEYVSAFLEATQGTIKRFRDNVPGKDWLRGFFDRHRELKVKRAQSITYRKAFVSRRTVETWFQAMQPKLTGPDAIPPERILNFDETNLKNDPGNPFVIVRCGTRHPRRAIAHSKTGISVMFAGTADGTILAPYVVYKAKSVKPEWQAEFPEPAAYYSCSPSGWFRGSQFAEWFKRVVIPWADQWPTASKLVLCDNLASHFSPEVMDLCVKHRISFNCFPTNTTHFLQPLDVAFFGPLKKRWREILEAWRLECPRIAFKKCEFPRKLQLLVELMNESNVAAGFKAAGLYPFNVNEALRHLPAPADPPADKDGQILAEYLMSKAKPTESATPSKRQTKSAVAGVPGIDIQTVLSTLPTTPPAGNCTLSGHYSSS